MPSMTFEEFRDYIENNESLTAMFEKASMALDQNIQIHESVELAKMEAQDKDLAEMVKNTKLTMLLFSVYRLSGAQITNENIETVIKDAFSNPLYKLPSPN